MKREVKALIAVSICLLLMLAGGAILHNSQRALAQSEPTGGLNMGLTATDRALNGRPIMISAIRDGNVVNQHEVQFGVVAGETVSSTRLDLLPAGVCDVRVEGEGIVTEVKRGVHVYPGRDGSLRFVVRPGAGVHIVEYATGGLSREEIAARIEKLEAAVTQLQKAVQSK